MTSREAPHHRSLYCVKQFGCRRTEYLERNNAYNRRWHRLHGYGTWQPLVSAEPVKSHIASLRAAGASTTSIASAAKISRSTLARIIYGELGQRSQIKLRAEAAEAVLAVRAEHCAVPNGARVDATGTRRRLQALVASGWTFTALASEIGIHDRHLGALARAVYVNAGTARKIKTAYKRIVRLTPEQCGVTAASRAIARGLARKEGWHSPLAWDDIDDPTAEPEVTAPYSPPAGNGRDSMRMAELEHLLALGESEAAIAKQMGSSEAYIHDLVIVLRNRKTATSDMRKAA